MTTQGNTVRVNGDIVFEGRLCDAEAIFNARVEALEAGDVVSLRDRADITLLKISANDDGSLTDWKKA